MSSIKDFSDMTPQEIIDWENKTGSVSFFQEENSVVFQKTVDTESLVVMYQSSDFNLILIPEQIKRLKKYLNDNF